MYFNFSGCLVSFLIFLLIFLIIKELWWLIVGIVLVLIVFYWGKLKYLYIVNKEKIKESTYNPQMGEVYILCPYCNSKVKVTAITCPNCGRALN